ncbi:MAG: hypothetical protein IPN15_22805 [Saprospiraceae bacterium]|nr:hypothetical protein [Candidatus Vicinibacter affinis]
MNLIWSLIGGGSTFGGGGRRRLVGVNWRWLGKSYLLMDKSSFSVGIISLTAFRIIGIEISKSARMLPMMMALVIFLS